MSEWFEDETLWETLEPFLFPPERLASAQEEVEQLLRLVGDPGRDVLDLACGPGRHSLALAARGHRVTGVDHSPFLLDRARARATESGVEVEWVRQDMRQFVRESSYDLALSLYTSLGYFDDPQDDLIVLRNLHANLRPAGTCVLEMMGKERLAREFQPTVSQQAPDGSLVIQRHEVIEDWTRVRNEWIVVREGKARSHRFTLRVYSGQELRDRLHEAGFGEVRLFGGLDGSPFDRDAARLVAVARRR